MPLHCHVSCHAHHCSPALKTVQILRVRPLFLLDCHVCFFLVVCIAVKWRSGVCFLFLCSYFFLNPWRNLQLSLALLFKLKSFFLSIHFIISVEACLHCPYHNEQSKQNLERQAILKKIKLGEARQSNETKRDNSLGRAKIKDYINHCPLNCVAKWQNITVSPTIAWFLQCAWPKVHKNNWNETERSFGKTFPVFCSLILFTLPVSWRESRGCLQSVKPSCYLHIKFTIVHSAQPTRPSSIRPNSGCYWASLSLTFASANVMCARSNGKTTCANLISVLGVESQEDETSRKGLLLTKTLLILEKS